jgi:hypothetical protein
MNYSKPEIAVIGDAAMLIQGIRHSGQEVPQLDGLQNPADCELSD